MPSRSWVIFKNWMKDCVLDTHLPDNHKKNGELKFIFDSIDDTGWAIEAQGGFNG